MAQGSTKSQNKKSRGKRRSDSRRFASKVSFGIIVAGLIVGLASFANKWMGRAELQTIMIKGMSVLDSVELVKQAQIPEDVSVREINLEKIEERVSAHPFVSEVAVYRGGSGMLVLDVHERAPVAVTIVNEKPIYVDRHGVALPYRFGSVAPDVPLISGVVGEQGLDSLLTVEVLEVIESIEKSDGWLAGQIAEVRRTENGEFEFTLVHGSLHVRAGEPDKIVGRLGKLKAFMLEVLAQKKDERIASIDIRWDGQVVVRQKAIPEVVRSEEDVSGESG